MLISTLKKLNNNRNIWLHFTLTSSNQIQRFLAPIFANFYGEIVLKYCKISHCGVVKQATDARLVLLCLTSDDSWQILNSVSSHLMSWFVEKYVKNLLKNNKNVHESPIPFSKLWKNLMNRRWGFGIFALLSLIELLTDVNRHN